MGIVLLNVIYLNTLAVHRCEIAIERELIQTLLVYFNISIEMFVGLQPSEGIFDPFTINSHFLVFLVFVKDHDLTLFR